MREGTGSTPADGQIQWGTAPGRWTSVQVRALLLSAFVLFCDGFDLLAISYAAPAIRQHLDLTAATMGVVFATGVIGMIVGGIVLGPVADRVGARPIMAGSITLAGVATIAVAFAPSLTALIAARFATGIGLGGVLPVAYAIAGDYAPAARKRLVLACVAIGMPLGGAAAGLCWIRLSPMFGWESLFWCGGVLSLFTAVLSLYISPESLSFLWARGRHDRLQSLRERLPASVAIKPADSSATEVKGPAVLLSPEWRLLTLTLWLASFLSLFGYYLVANWLPSVALTSGSVAHAGASALAALQIGMTGGGLAVGAAMDRFNGYRLIGGAALVTAAAAALAMTTGSAATFVILAGLFGFTSSFAQGGLNFAATTVFPAEVRSTSIAWAISAGRTGGVVGPMIGSLLVDGNAAITYLMGAATLAFALCGILMLALAQLRAWK